MESSPDTNGPSPRTRKEDTKSKRALSYAAVSVALLLLIILTVGGYILRSSYYQQKPAVDVQTLNHFVCRSSTYSISVFNNGNATGVSLDAPSGPVTFLGQIGPGNYFTPESVIPSSYISYLSELGTCKNSDGLTFYQVYKSVSTSTLSH